MSQIHYQNAFLFGKFFPLHLGHIGMINFALTQCDHLSIMVCCSDQELISGEIRYRWLNSTFANEIEKERLTLILFEYCESEYANSSVASEAISQQWSYIFRDYFPNADAVITSEPYGEMVASYLNIPHIYFDPNRHNVPISATQIRHNIPRYWDYLPKAVRQDLAFSIVILGTESTGKTTLTTQLSEYYHATAVYEAGRDLIDDSTDFSFEDLISVADAHAKAILDGKMDDQPFVIIDTDLNITQSYAQFAFNQTFSVDNWIKKANRATLYLYLDCDVPFIQDGTRMNAEDRLLLDQSHRSMLDKNKIHYHLISGNWIERWDQCIALINSKMKAFYSSAWRREDD